MKDNDKKQVYFIFVTIFVVMVTYFIVDFYISLDNSIKILLISFIILLILTYTIMKSGTILFLEEYRRAVIMRFGKLSRIAGPGWALIIPGIEDAEFVDLRTKTIDTQRQDVITKDGIMINIDAIIYMKISKNPKDVANSVLNVENVENASRLFVVAQIRDVVGTMTLEEIISQINDLNKKIKGELEQVTKDWGVIVDSVEIKNIKIPDEVIQAMHKQKAAMQQKLANIELAEGEREKIKAIHEAASKLDDKSLSYYYIKALEEMSKGEATKIIFPMEFTKMAQILSGKLTPTEKEVNTIDSFFDKHKVEIAKILNKLEHEEIKKE